MKNYEEFEKAFNDIITDPDKNLANAKQFLEDLKSSLLTRDNLATKVDELTTQNNTLRDTNIKLYMSEGKAPEDSNNIQEEEDPDVKAVEEYLNGLSDKGGNE